MISSSKSKAQTSTSTTNTSRNLNLQDLDGATAISETGDVSIISTDHNAIDRATSLAALSVETGQNIALENQNFLRDIFAGAGDTFSKVLTFARETVGAHQDTITALAKPSDERLQDVTEQSQRTVLIALGVVVAGVAAYMIFGRR